MIRATPWAAVVAGSGLFMLAVLAVVHRRRDSPGSRLFALVIALATFYTFGYVGQVLAGTLDGKLLWLKVQYLALVFIPVATLVFALDYTGRTDRVTARTLGALLVVPVLTLVAVWLEPGHGLVFTDLHLLDVGGRPDLEYDLGPLGVAAWTYQFVLFFVAVLLFFALAVSDHAAYRTQGLILLVAFAAPIAAAGFLLVSPGVVVDPTPLTFLVTGVLVTWGVYRSDFLDVVPVDRERTLDRIRGAVVVLDTRDRVVDVNRTARELFGDAFDVGDDAGAVLRRAGFDASVEDLVDGVAVTRSGEAPRRYEVSRDEVETRFGGRRGAVLTLYDVTERWRVEQRLQDRNEQLAVLSRLMRHDVRNDASVILGWAETLGEEVGAEQRPAVDRIRTSARHVVELTETARGLTDALAGDAEIEVEPVRLDRVLADAVAAARSQYPDAAFGEPDAYPEVAVPANELLQSVFRNLLNNAVQHNDSEPEVTVDVTVEGDAVRVVVADNGPGIPPELSDRLFERDQKGADSTGTGLGLYLVAHLVETFGGTVEARENDPRGTRMVVTLPLVE